MIQLFDRNCRLNLVMLANLSENSCNLLPTSLAMIILLNSYFPLQVLVDGPMSKVPRCEMRLNELHLTKFRLRFPFTGSTRVVRKAWQAGNIDELWKQTMWARKVEAKKKVSVFSSSLIVLKPLIHH